MFYANKMIWALHKFCYIKSTTITTLQLHSKNYEYNINSFPQQLILRIFCRKMLTLLVRINSQYLFQSVGLLVEPC